MSENKNKKNKTRNKNLTNKIRSIMRGNASTSKMVLSIQKCLFEYPSQELKDISDFIKLKTFCIEENTFSAPLDLSKNHFNQINRLKEINDKNI
ncbi:hypothetical protein, partial [Acetobacter orleanensis]